MAVVRLREGATATLRGFVKEEAGHFPALPYVWQALTARGRLLAAPDGFAWGLLSALIGEAVGAPAAANLVLSAAAECFITALDVLDDVEDADSPDALWRDCGIATATNVATLLLFLAQRGVARLVECGVPPATTARLACLLATHGARACTGQQKDLDSCDGRPIDEGRYLAMVGEKSGSLVEYVCRAAATLGSGDAEEVEAFSQFGFNLGMALQITNDVAGVSRDSADRNDLLLGKQTLPVIFALESVGPKVWGDMMRVLRSPGSAEGAGQGVRRILELLVRTGALHYAMVVADVYWERALECLDRVTRAEAEHLRDLVRQLDGGMAGGGE